MSTTKVLLEQVMSIFYIILWLLLCYKGERLQQRLKYLLFGPLEKDFTDICCREKPEPWLCTMPQVSVTAFYTKTCNFK